MATQEYLMDTKLNQYIHDAYEKYDITLPQSSVGYQTFKDKYLPAIRASIKNMEARAFSVSFNPHEANPQTFPRSVHWTWKSLEENLATMNTVGILFRVPLFWQVEPLVFKAAQKSQSFLFVNDILNMPVGRTSLQLAHLDTILTTDDDVIPFAEHLKKYSVEIPKNWIIVHPATSKNISVLNTLRETISSIHVAREVHIFPGVPVLIQCRDIQRDYANLFHIADGYTVEHTDSETLVNGTTSDFLPVYKYQLPGTLLKTPAVCACGKDLYTYTN